MPSLGNMIYGYLLPSPTIPAIRSYTSLLSTPMHPSYTSYTHPGTPPAYTHRWLLPRPMPPSYPHPHIPLTHTYAPLLSTPMGMLTLQCALQLAIWVIIMEQGKLYFFGLYF